MTLALQILAVLVDLHPDKLQKLQSSFQTVHYYPETQGPPPDDILEQCEMFLTNWSALGSSITLDKVPNLKVVQLTSAGVNAVMKQPLFQNPEAVKQIQVCTASGMHVKSIPQYIICQIINILSRHHIQFQICRNERRWPKKSELFDAVVDVNSEAPDATVYGKTAGLLGYGHIARETARVLKAMNVNVIAANSSGKAHMDEGYILPNTGDRNGSIPSAYYNTSDRDSFKGFLGKCDILVCSLPSTPATEWILSPEMLNALPGGSILVNVGRGDLVHTDDLIAALDRSGGLYGAVLDVTDPEPLPNNHLLFHHPRVIVTPHTSGEFSGYYDAAADLLLDNVLNIRKGGKPLNLMNVEKGY